MHLLAARLRTTKGRLAEDATKSASGYSGSPWSTLYYPEDARSWSAPTAQWSPLC